ncbi:hypothetical protein CKF54_03670 [Psittacicella hinzii]|uniref:Porin n=1 Tax=Psittacicella hinzii TaxID=2028575 RepID=A0A3A1Y6A7_9GAMM|nr:hypothetical protein [Psittacicella hinzii]RIY33041.1 hypothetical protein CKF54_03670 [Psittacicella hinzii]
MKKTLVALVVAAATLGSASAYTPVYSTDKGTVYLDGYLRTHYQSFTQSRDTKVSGGSYTNTFKYDDGKSLSLRLRFALGFDTVVGEKGKFGVYARYQKDFTSTRFDNVTASSRTLQKSHNSRPVYLTVGRFYYDYDDFVRFTVGVRGEDDAAEFNQFDDALDLVPRARTAFDLVNQLDLADGADKRTFRFDFKFGENKDHYASVSYGDSKTGSSTTYYSQYAAAYDYKGFKDLELQVVGSAGHFNGAGTTASKDTYSVDFAAYYTVFADTKLSGTFGLAQSQVNGETTDYYVYNVELVNSTFKYAQPAVGYSYVDGKTKTSAGTTKDKTHTVYGRVYSEVYTYKTTNVLVGLEASYRRVVSTATTNTKTKNTYKNAVVFARYNY